MNLYKFIATGIILFLVSFYSFSSNDNLTFSQISTQDGLSQNTVRDILEDKKGFIWAGTLDGLNRYDGYQIITYKPQLGNPNSLVDHRIKDVMQDKDGYLWIKTYKNEYSCYDPSAETFINYLASANLKDKTLFYNDYYEARNGDIWLWGETNGFIQIKKNNKEFKSKAFFAEEPLNPNRFRCRFLFEDSKSNIWVGGDQGIYKISKKNEAILAFNRKCIYTKAIEINNKIYFLTDSPVIVIYDMKTQAVQEITDTRLNNDIFTNAAILNPNELLLTTKQSGLVTLNVNNKIFSTGNWLKDQNPNNRVEMITDSNGGIWLYNHTGNVWYFNNEKKDIKQLKLIPNNIVEFIDLERYNIFIDTKDLIWITTYGNGLFTYDAKKEVLTNYKSNLNQNSPASDYLLSITEDKYGNIWIGSEYAGIIKVVRSDHNLHIIRPEKETSIGKNNNIRTVFRDSFGKLWIGSKNGSLYLYDEKLETSKVIVNDINPYAILEDSNQHLWVGTKGRGLYIYDLKNFNKVAHYTQESQGATTLSNNTIFSLLKDSKNRIWVGSFGGGINLVTNSNSTHQFRHFFSNDGNRKYIRCLYQDSKGLIWAGSSDGIIRFDPDALIKDYNSFDTYNLNIDNKLGVNCNDIKVIYEDADGDIWIGTAGGGLNKYVPATADKPEHFLSYTVEDGLSGDIISGILEDEDSNLWLSTENGITKFNKKNQSFMIYNFSEKTYGNHFNENANIYLPDGNMLWGSLDGLVVFNPKTFTSDNRVPAVTFTNFFIYDQRVKAGEEDSPLNQSISYTDKIELNYKQNTFTIEFATLSLKDSQKNKYTYMLENYDKQWSKISHYNTATYKNLSPGTYYFLVKGSNSDGIWNDDVSRIEIVISPPFWKSIYAYIVYLLLAILLLYAIFKIVYKFNILNNNIKVEQELTNHKLRFFTNISHEFRTPLTLIRGAIENLNDQSNVSEPVQKQINVLSRNSVILTRLIDQLLEFRKLQNNVLTLDLEKIDFIEFSKEIYSGFQDIAIQKNISYTFSNNIDSFDMYIDRRKIDKVIYNLISNAFKFTPKDGRIEVIININNDKCHIMVKDNGIGVAKEKQHLLFSRFMQINFSSSGTGVGLSLVKEFVDVHKGKIWYEDNKDKGSIFNIELPTSASVYDNANFVETKHEHIIKDKIINTNKPILYPSETSEDIKLPEIDESTLANYKILIIDDNDDIRNFLSDEFSKYVMIDVAENGKQGLEKAIENNPDLIICDVMMPEMDGFEVTKRMKEDFQTCHIPIILLTAHSSLEHQLQGIESGADAYIMKPFSLKYLVTRVFKLIEQREQLKKRFSNEYVLDGNLITSTEKDKEFFNLINKILDDHLDDTQFTVDKFAELAKQRRTIFYKKVKGITGFSPNELIKIKRLKKAAELLLTGEFTVSEISYKVGFEDPFYFSKCFKAQYKCAPSKYGQTIISNDSKE